MSSHRQIFKSTALVGGAQVIVLLVGLLRQKALAVWLGAEGVGLVGLFSTGVSLIGVVTGLGIGASGVRQIAESSSSGDQAKLARTARTLRLVALTTSIVGMLVTICFCRQLSLLTFGSYDFAVGYAVVGVSLLFQGISTGQIALLQGLRRLKEMAAAQIMGAALGSAVGVALIFWLREGGIAWFLVAVTAAGSLASWWFARRVVVPKPVMGWQDYSAEARGLLAMGIAFMTANLVAAGIAFFTRVLLIHLDMGTSSVGLYQATWALSSQYVGVVLGAMAADFSPRLTAVATDNAQTNRLVNEQMELGVLIALPGVLATLVFAPWILHLFNSSEFTDAASLVRWHMIGIFLRVLSWPLGMIVIAKGASRVFIYVEIAMGLFHAGLIYGCTKLWHLDGVGIAFSILYITSYLVNWMICRRMSGYTVTSRGRKIICAASVIVLGGFLLAQFMAPLWALSGGVVLLAVTSAGCYIGMRKLLQVDPWAAVMKKLGIRKS